MLGPRTHTPLSVHQRSNYKHHGTPNPSKKTKKHTSHSITNALTASAPGLKTDDATLVKQPLRLNPGKRNSPFSATITNTSIGRTRLTIFGAAVSTPDSAKVSQTVLAATTLARLTQ